MMMILVMMMRITIRMIVVVVILMLVVLVMVMIMVTIMMKWMIKMRKVTQQICPGSDIYFPPKYRKIGTRKGNLLRKKI